MLAFASGTVPLLLLGQVGFSWAGQARGGAWVPALRRASALVAAATLLGFAVWGRT
jgi:hypothetical protein